jgi:hypothetical protein
MRISHIIDGLMERLGVGVRSFFLTIVQGVEFSE